MVRQGLGRGFWIVLQSLNELGLEIGKDEEGVERSGTDDEAFPISPRFGGARCFFIWLAKRDCRIEVVD